jgi:hypothetical protein
MSICIVREIFYTYMCIQYVHILIPHMYIVHVHIFLPHIIDILGLFCYICSFLLFVRLFFFTYALLAIVYVSHVKDGFFNTPRLLFLSKKTSS